MCGKLNSPMFLFNVGLLTLLKINSLMSLAKPHTKANLTALHSFSQALSMLIEPLSPI